MNFWNNFFWINLNLCIFCASNYFKEFITRITWGIYIRYNIFLLFVFWSSEENRLFGPDLHRNLIKWYSLWWKLTCYKVQYRVARCGPMVHAAFVHLHILLGPIVIYNQTMTAKKTHTLSMFGIVKGFYERVMIMSPFYETQQILQQYCLSSLFVIVYWIRIRVIFRTFSWNSFVSKIFQF